MEKLRWCLIQQVCQGVNMMCNHDLGTVLCKHLPFVLQNILITVLSFFQIQHYFISVYVHMEFI